MSIVDDLKDLKIGEIIEGALLKDYTTYKVGGKAMAIVIPDDVESLIILMNYIHKKAIKYKILGKGSNVIFNDKGYDGIIVKLDRLDKFEINKNAITLGAGYSLIKAAMRLSRLGYTGMEFATGIPGSVGGAIYMNAGAYNSDMGYIVKEIRVLTKDLKVKTLSNKDINFHYRTSYLQTHPDDICIEATVILKKGNSKVILDMIEERKRRRLDTQPLNFPSAGSVFRNPPNDYAGRLVEELGYKGYEKNGAAVSEKHANFIINKGTAKGEDIKNLILEIQKKVKDKYDIELKVEQEFVE